MKGFIRPSAREDILRQYRYLLLEESSPVAAERCSNYPITLEEPCEPLFINELTKVIRIPKVGLGMKIVWGVSVAVIS
ncbi:MAG: hypothetical protein ACHP79_09270, partial [Terriglobales bacterium]